MVPINGMGVNLTSTNALGIIALAEKTMNTAHRERETCLRGTPVYLRQYFCFFWFLEHIWVQEKEKSKQSSGGARIVYISAGGKWLYSRLGVLAAAGLAAGFATRHFEWKIWR
jgi:hypothetical protein